MECRTALQLAAYLAPGKAELDAEHTAALEAHVRACPECARRIRFGQAFDQNVARAMKGVPVPPGLKERIVARLTPPRLTFHRRRSTRVWAAVALVFIATGVVLTWNGNDKPTLNPQQIAIREEEQAKDRRRAAEDWLAQQGIAFAPETPLNLGLANGWGIAPFLGKKVPMLVLVSPEHRALARVYVVRSDEFNLRNLPETQDSLGGLQLQFSVAIIPDRERREKVAYVVILYPAESLDIFRQKTAGS